MYFDPKKRKKKNRILKSFGNYERQGDIFDTVRKIRPEEDFDSRTRTFWSWGGGKPIMDRVENTVGLQEAALAVVWPRK